jgi:hypothetical protein
VYVYDIVVKERTSYGYKEGLDGLVLVRLLVGSYQNSRLSSEYIYWRINYPIFIH